MQTDVTNTPRKEIELRTLEDQMLERSEVIERLIELRQRPERSKVN